MARPLSLISAVSQAFRNTAPVPQTQNSPMTELFQMPKKGSTTTPLDMYSSVGTLFAVVNRLANDTSAVCWKLYRKTDGNTKTEDRQEVVDHPALKLLNKPNPFMTRQEFIEVIQQHIDLTGEAWLQVASSDLAQMPLQLWPLRPDRVSISVDTTEFLTGYTYTTPDGMKIPLDKEDVIGLRMPDPLNLYRGVGPVSAILTDLDSSRLAAEWNRNFFKNSANPGGVIEVPDRLDDRDFQELKIRWQEQHKGTQNAHVASILEGGMKWLPYSINMRDLQFAELREVSATQILQAFGFPKFKLGDVTDVNRANAVASETMYARSLLKPRLERIKQALNNDLLPLFGTSGMGVEFDYDSPEPDDRELEDASLVARANAAKTLVDAGYDPVAVLEVVELPPMGHSKPVQLKQDNTPNPPIPPTTTANGEPDEQVV